MGNVLFDFSNKWLILNHNTIIMWSGIAFIFITVIYLIVLSILNHNLIFPKNHPYLFLIETLSICMLSSSIILLSAYLRNNFTTITIVKFFITTFKVGLVHILLQFSGFYDYVYDYDNIKKNIVTSNNKQA